MAKKVKKISINALDTAIAKDIEPDKVKIVEWNGLAIEVKYRLSLGDVMRFVNRVVQMCYSEDSGEYMPELLEFAKDSTLLEMYTNITLPNDVEKIYSIIRHRGLIITVEDAIDKDQFAEIHLAISKRIALINQLNVSKTERALEESLESVNKLMDGFRKISEDIDPESIKNIAEAFANGGINEDKLVKAIQKNIALREVQEATGEAEKGDDPDNYRKVNLMYAPKKKKAKPMKRVDTEGLDTPRGL